MFSVFCFLIKYLSDLKIIYFIEDYYGKHNWKDVGSRNGQESDSDETSEKFNVYFENDESRKNGEKGGYSIESGVIHDVIKSISLETGETAKLYVESSSGDDIYSNSKFYKDEFLNNGYTNSTGDRKQQNREWIEADSNFLELKSPPSVKFKYNEKNMH